MPKFTAPLSLAAVHAKIKQQLKKGGGTFAVGGVAGLMLQVQSETSQSWILRTPFGGKVKNYGCGRFPDATLADARETARKLRAEIAAGIDPQAQRQKIKTELRAADATRVLFRDAAAEAIPALTATLTNEKNKAQWLTTIETYITNAKTKDGASLGDMPIVEITTRDIHAALAPIWLTINDTAKRTQERAHRIFDWAYTHRGIERLSPARWQGNLDKLLPSPDDVKKLTGGVTEHHPALPWQRAGEYIVALRESGHWAAPAYEFLILTAARTQEVRFMRWREIDLEHKGRQWDYNGPLWSAPPLSMKGRKLHLVPLCDRAVEILEALPKGKADDYVFKSPKGNRNHENFLLELRNQIEAASVKNGGEGYRELGTNEPCSPHGFRSSFKDWARKTSKHPDEISELCIAHEEKSPTRAAYARDAMIEERAELLAEWGRFCSAPMPENVVRMPRRAKTAA